MLPDLPRVKQDLQYILDRYLSKATNERLGIFADVPHHKVHEGASTRVYRADGSVEDTEMREASAEMTLKCEDVPRMTVADRLAKLNEMADTMAKQMSGHLFAGLNQSLERAGQVVDGKGKPFSFESVFSALDTMHVDFDEQGNPKGLKFVVGAALVPKLREMAEQEKNDPSIKTRHDEIMLKKWQEWRDREAARKLVG